MGQLFYFASFFDHGDGKLVLGGLVHGYLKLSGQLQQLRGIRSQLIFLLLDGI